MTLTQSELQSWRSSWVAKRRRAGMIPTSTVFGSDNDQAERDIVLSLLFAPQGTLATRKTLLGVGK